MSKVVIIDYGMCNLGSVRRAFEECGASSVLVSENPRDLESADKIVLPGVGAFSKGMSNLNERGWAYALKQKLEKDRIPLLGICLGMQLMADLGDEGGEIKGLGLIPGHVTRLKSTSIDFRIPHIGWNEVHQKKPLQIFDGIKDKTDFYFVHSYHFIPHSTQEFLAAQTPYCDSFASVVSKGNIFGVQFHPEKSQKPGFQLIRNFLKC